MAKSDPYRIEKAFIEQLRAERLRQRLTYQQMADKTGLHRTAISFIERGINHPTLVNCLKIATALGIDLRDLLKN